MSDLVTVETLTTEILVYKQQTALNIIEIGKRLIQVKEQLPHGGWGKYLEEQVDIHERTAQKFMKAATEFSNTPSTAYLGMGKVFELLELPADQREGFIQSHPVDDMTQKQLREAIKAQKDAEQQVTEAQGERDELQEELTHMKENLQQLIREKSTLQTKASTLEEENEDYKTTMEQARTSMDSLVEKIKAKDLELLKLTEQLQAAQNGPLDEEQIAKLKAQLQQAQEEINGLQEELKKPPTISTVIEEKIPEATVQELARLQEEVERLKSAPKDAAPGDAAALKYRVSFEVLKSNFNQLLQSLAEITDTDTHTKYQAATKKLLAVMGERL